MDQVNQKSFKFECWKKWDWTIYFIVFYVLPLFVLERQVIGLYPDEYAAIERANYYWKELVEKGSLYLYGMNKYTGSLIYYLLGLFTKILGESVLTLRFFALLFTFTNLVLLHNILEKYFSYKQIRLALIGLMSLSGVVLYGRMAIEVSTLLPFFILMGCYFFITKKYLLMGIFAGLAITTHPVCVPFLCLLVVWKARELAWRKWFLGLSSLCVILLFRIPHYYNTLSEKRASQLYFGFGKFIDIPLNFLDFLNGKKIIQTSVGHIEYIVIPTFLLALIAFVTLNYKKINWRKPPVSLIFGILSFWVLSFLLLPALNFQYFFFVACFSALLLFLHLNYKVLIPLIILNSISVLGNYYLPYSQTGGKGTFYQHNYFDQGIKNRNPYHSYYFLDLESELRELAESDVEYIFTNDYFLINILKFYQNQWGRFQVATIDKIQSIAGVEGARIAFVSYAYHKLPETIKVENRTLLKSQLGKGKINIYRSM